jgi:hypothetical protein
LSLLVEEEVEEGEEVTLLLLQTLPLLLYQ